MGSIDGTILEPCCGETAAIANDFRPKHAVIKNDFDPEITDAHHLDSQDRRCFLLRSTWLEDPKSEAEQGQCLWEHPMAVRMTMPRHAFRKAVKKPDKWQADACAHVWAVWRKDGWRAEIQRPVIPRSAIPGFYENPEKKYSVCHTTETGVVALPASTGGSF